MKEAREITEFDVKKTIQRLSAGRSQATISRLVNASWQSDTAVIANCSDTKIQLELTGEEPPAARFKVGQTIGVAAKDRYCRLIFNVMVLGVGKSVNGQAAKSIIVSVPDCIKRIQKRNYQRTAVPNTLKVKATVWKWRNDKQSEELSAEHHWDGRLVDICADGIGVGLDISHKREFELEQLIGIRFTPADGHEPFILDGEITNMNITADCKGICLGINLLGLEASVHGRKTLQRLIRTVDKFQNMNQTKR